MYLSYCYVCLVNITWLSNMFIHLCWIVVKKFTTYSFHKRVYFHSIREKLKLNILYSHLICGCFLCVQGLIIRDWVPVPVVQRNGCVFPPQTVWDSKHALIVLHQCNTNIDQMQSVQVMRECAPINVYIYMYRGAYTIYYSVQQPKSAETNLRTVGCWSVAHITLNRIYVE